MKNHGSMSEKGNVEQLDLEDMRNEKIKYPKGIFFIMATELSERFSYYGMRAVLTIYMRNVLTFTENQATSYYHIFLMLCYGLPVFWGVISDSFIGKFKTILYVSILFAVGNIILALSSVPPLHLPTKAFFFVGLLLMAVGTAGLKPNVAPLGGEQFVLPEQTKQLTQFFSVFFFVVTIGNMVSTVITPVFRRDVSCFGMENCYPLAFGVPAMVMIFAVLIFLCGKPLYKVTKPNGNVLVKVTKCVAHALSNRGKAKKLSGHWLDSASDSFDQEIIADTKGLLRILPYFLPVPMFFALYEQLGSRWTLQATRMKGTVGEFSIKPDQMQVSNAILMFISLPLFNWVVYPVLAKWGIKLRTLQRMVIGGILAAASFGVAGIVEMKIEPSIKTQPAEAHTVLTLVNAMPCPVTVWTNSTASSTVYNFTVEKESFLTLPSIKFNSPATFVIKTTDGNEKCPLKSEWVGEKSLLPKEYQSLSISKPSDVSKDLNVNVYPFEDDYKKSKDGNARIRFVVEQDTHTPSHLKSDVDLQVIVTPVDEGLPKTFELWQRDNMFYSETEEIDEEEYIVSLQSSKSKLNIDKAIKLLNGGSYNLIVYTNTQNNVTQFQLVTITPPNDIHILWLLPQYILMAWGEILFIVSGMEFAYTEAPSSMRSVVQAIWHLMNACGNLIVIIAAQNHGQGSQAIEFFVFGGCMFVDAMIYGFMARRYKYVSLDDKPIVMH